MGTALWLLLLGLGTLAIGLVVGRYYVPDDRQLRRTARHGRAYLRALSEVLARDSEAALAELREVVEDNIEDPDPYFAMAALFRSRGEHERAIRVHQALALRERDRKRLRVRALYELGLDFRAAGMPRRATRAMEEVLAEDATHEGGLRAAAGLYEEQGRWGDAAAMWRRLSKHRGEPSITREHHLRVAAAQAAIGRGELDSAKQWLKEARALPAGETAHFAVAAAELAAARDNPEGARERLRQALRAEPSLAPYLWPQLLRAERELAAGRLATGDRRDELAGDHDERNDDDDARDGGAAPGALAAAATLALPSGDDAEGAEAGSGAAAGATHAATRSEVAGSAQAGSAGEPGSGAGSAGEAGSGAGSAGEAGSGAGSAGEAAAGGGAKAAALPQVGLSVRAETGAPSTPLAVRAEATVGPVARAEPDAAAAPVAVRRARTEPGSESPADAAARARVDALLRELAADAPRLDVALARAAAARRGPAAVQQASLRAISEAFPGTAAGQVARAKLALERGDGGALGGALAELTGEGGALAWALEARWRCGACGATSPSFAWRCASCRRWAALHLDTGEPAPPQEPRDRRGEARRADGSARGTSDDGRRAQEGANVGLPSPRLASGLSSEDLAERERKRSFLGRAGGWISSAWSGTRGGSGR
ncbi:MAG: hypothetical protein R3B48_04740 [Kofleriaceae bacterium]